MMSLFVLLITDNVIMDRSNSAHMTWAGTTIYMSPELMQINGAKPMEDAVSGGEKLTTLGYGRKTDIWSLGITLVEMATGTLFILLFILSLVNTIIQVKHHFVILLWQSTMCVS